MKITILSPSPDYRLSAGARIRYLRIEPLLQAMGHTLDIVAISKLKQPLKLDSDVYLFSKCYDASALLLARMFRDSGSLVGVDLFDDYFSQRSDARFMPQRNWLRAMRDLADFGLCSTPRMREVLSAYWPDHPAHVLNDPFGEAAHRELGDVVARKLERARTTGTIDVAWFGQGDNSRFPVGLRDLSAFGSTLRKLDRGAMNVRLRVLTNPRALKTAGLERLGRLGVPFEVNEWSEAAEQELLASSLVAYIPVNGQPFSAAKSLNRAVSALTHGVQVLSDGYPLYEPFSDLIYREAGQLVSDMDVGRLALRAETVPALIAKLAAFGDPAIEAAKFSAFLSSSIVGKRNNHRRTNELPPLAVLHGRDSPNDVHRSAQRLGHLSIGGPFSKSGPSYNVAFTLNEKNQPCVIFKAAAISRLAVGLSTLAMPASEFNQAPDEVSWRLDLTGVVPAQVARDLADARTTSLVRDLAAYSRGMKAALYACATVFPTVEVTVSENEAILSMPQMARQTELAA